MKFVYLDESGIGNPKHETHVVVAGAMVHADQQWKLVEEHLRLLADKHAPARARAHFAFHAKEIFHGEVGGAFPRDPTDSHDRERRFRILDDLSEIPRKFDLAIVASAVDRVAFAQGNPGVDGELMREAAVLMASLHTTLAVEAAMRTRAPEGEVALLVYEDNERFRRRIREIHNHFRRPEYFRGTERGDLIPLTRIVDTAHFAQKLDTSILQIADLCAFVIRRKLAGKPDADRFYDAFKSQVLFPHRMIVPSERFRFSLLGASRTA